MLSCTIVADITAREEVSPNGNVPCQIPGDVWQALLPVERVSGEVSAADGTSSDCSLLMLETEKTNLWGKSCGEWGDFVLFQS